MIKHCMIAAAALLSANAIAAQSVSSLDVVMATPMTQGEMAQVEGKAFGTARTGSCSTVTCTSLAGAIAVGTNGGHDGEGRAVGRAVSAVAKTASSKASR